MTVEAIGVAYPPSKPRVLQQLAASGRSTISTKHSIPVAFLQRRAAGALPKSDTFHAIGSHRARWKSSATYQPVGGEGAGYFVRFRSIFDSRAAARSTSKTVASDSR